MSAVEAWLGVLAVFVLTAGTGYFVAQEFAYVSADRLALARAAQTGDRKAARALKVLERLSFMLSGAQLGITVTGLVVGFIAEPSVSALLRPPLSGSGIPDGAVTGISVVLAFVLATAVQMVLGELAPKNLAIAVPERLARSLAASTLAYLKIVGPLVRIFDGAANRLLRRAGIEPVEELHHGATLEELGQLIGESHEQGHLPRETADLLDHALEFSERTLDEVMVPRVDAVFVRKDATAAEAVGLIGRHGHSNYPVLGDHPDDVAGVLGVRELMALPAAGSPGRRRARSPGAPCCCRTRCRCRTPWNGCGNATTSSPWSSTSTAVSRASSPTRTSPRSSWATSPTSPTPSPRSPSPTAPAGSWTPAAGSTRWPARPASSCPRRRTTTPWPA
ncbi:hypothetical protein SGLAM104S_02693 [Streptomyces glaucescens]